MSRINSEDHTNLDDIPLCGVDELLRIRSCIFLRTVGSIDVRNEINGTRQRCSSIPSVCLRRMVASFVGMVDVIQLDDLGKSHGTG